LSVADRSERSVPYFVREGFGSALFVTSGSYRGKEPLNARRASKLSNETVQTVPVFAIFM